MLKTILASFVVLVTAANAVEVSPFCAQLRTETDQKIFEILVGEKQRLELPVIEGHELADNVLPKILTLQMVLSTFGSECPNLPKPESKLLRNSLSSSLRHLSYVAPKSCQDRQQAIATTFKALDDVEAGLAKLPEILAKKKELAAIGTENYNYYKFYDSLFFWADIAGGIAAQFALPFQELFTVLSVYESVDGFLFLGARHLSSSAQKMATFSEITAGKLEADLKNIPKEIASLREAVSQVQALESRRCL